MLSAPYVLVAALMSWAQAPNADWQTLAGGNISLFSELCERTRGDAFSQMFEHATTSGANAVMGVRYDATEIMDGVTEVLCHGTAVVVEPETRPHT